MGKIILVVLITSMNNNKHIFLIAILLLSCKVIIGQSVRDTFVSYDLTDQEAAFENVKVLSSRDYHQWLNSNEKDKKIILNKYAGKQYKLESLNGLSESSYNCKKLEVSNLTFDYEPYLNLEFLYSKQKWLKLSPKQISYNDECDRSNNNYSFFASLIIRDKVLFKDDIKNINSWPKKFIRKIKKASHLLIEVIGKNNVSLASYNFYVGFPSENKVLEIK